MDISGQNVQRYQLCAVNAIRKAWMSSELGQNGKKMLGSPSLFTVIIQVLQGRAFLSYFYVV